MNRKKKILLILNYRADKSGITNQINLLKESLSNEGYYVKIVSTHGSILIRIISVFKGVKEGSESDLIMCAGSAYYGIFPMIVCSIISYFTVVPILYIFHDGQAKIFLQKYHLILKLFLRNNSIIVATEFLMNTFKQYNFNALLIPNFIRLDEKNINRYNHNNKVIWCRSFEELYQPELALKIAFYLVSKYKCELHFFVNGSLMNDLAKKYHHPQIYFRGFVERDTLLNEYTKYSIMINTSKYDNFPMTLLEAGYNNLLIVSSRAEGIISVFSDDEIIYPPENSCESFVEIFEKIFNNQKEYDCIRDAFRIKIRSFNWNSVKDKWLTIIENKIIKN